MAGLHHLVRLMTAYTGIDRSDQRETVHHRRLLRQMFADGNPRHLGLDRFERSAVIQRSLRFGVPGIDVTRSACHPEQNHTLLPHRLTRLAGSRPELLQAGKREPPQSGEACFEHIPTAEYAEPFTVQWMEVGKGVLLVLKAGHESHSLGEAVGMSTFASDNN